MKESWKYRGHICSWICWEISRQGSEQEMQPKEEGEKDWDSVESKDELLERIKMLKNNSKFRIIFSNDTKINGKE